MPLEAQNVGKGHSRVDGDEVIESLSPPRTHAPSVASTHSNATSFHSPSESEWKGYTEIEAKRLQLEARSEKANANDNKAIHDQCKQKKSNKKSPKKRTSVKQRTAAHTNPRAGGSQSSTNLSPSSTGAGAVPSCPGAFAVPGQTATEDMMQESNEDLAVPSLVSARPMVFAAEVVPEAEDERLQQEREAQLQIQVQEVRRVLGPKVDATPMYPDQAPQNNSDSTDGTYNCDEGQRKKRRRAILFVTLIIAIAVAVGVAVPLVLAGNNNNKNTTSLPDDQPTSPPLPPLVTPDIPNGPWVQIGNDLDGDVRGGLTGWSLSLSKNASIVAISSPGPAIPDNLTSTPGFVRIYQLSKAKSSWDQLGQDLVGESENDEFGKAVSLNHAGDIVAVGAPSWNGAGSRNGYVRVYQYDSTLSYWNLLGEEIIGALYGGGFGVSVSLSAEGFAVAVGAISSDYNGFNSGHVQAYGYDATTSVWHQVGQDIVGRAAYDQFGFSVRLNGEGDVMAIGANQFVSEGTGYVRAYHFDTTSSQWEQMGQELFGQDKQEEYGGSVALSKTGTIMSVGAPVNNGNGYISGRACVYQYDPAVLKWVQLGNDIYGEAPTDALGKSVSLSNEGTVLATGAWAKNNWTGRTRIFKYDAVALNWIQVGDAIEGEEELISSGMSVSISEDGTVVAISAPWAKNNNGDVSGHVRVYTLNQD